METKHLELWQKIAHFKLDDPRATLPFSKKLMTEQKWSLPETQRAIAEYKKFMFLVVVEPNGASPSKKVDEVWHLHITFTKNYADFCANVAPQFIHHHPSAGGLAEKSRHAEWYKDTLRAYGKYFGAPPPPDIWEYPLPLPEDFLPKNSPFLMPDTEGGYVFSDSDFYQQWEMDWNTILPFVVSVLALPLYFGNPFHLRGPEFLVFYALIAVIGLVVTYFKESKINAEVLIARKNSIPQKLSPLPLAWLMQGNNRFFQTAVVEAIEARILTRSPTQNWTYNRFVQMSEIGNPLITTLQCLENAETHLADTKHRTQLFQDVMRPALSLTIRQFEAFKKALFSPKKWHVVMAVVYGIGLVRLAQGLITGHTVLFLIVLMAFIFFLKHQVTSIFEKTIAQFITDTTAENAHQATPNPALNFAYGAPVPDGSMVLLSSFMLMEVMSMPMKMPPNHASSAASSCGGSSCGSDGGGSCGGGGDGGGGCGGGCGGCGGGD